MFELKLDLNKKTQQRRKDMSIYMNKMLWMTLMTLPGLMVSEAGFGITDPDIQKEETKQVNETDEAHGQRVRKDEMEKWKNSKTWTGGHDKLLEESKTQFFDHNKIDINAPAQVLFYIKLDERINEYKGDQNKCNDHNKGTFGNHVTSAGDNSTLFRTLILDCNQNQLKIIPGSYILSDIFRFRSYENNEYKALNYSVTTIGKVNAPQFYKQLSPDPKERFKHVLILNLLGDFYRKPGLSDDLKKKLGTCIQNYTADTFENIKLKLNATEKMPEKNTHKCKDFFVKGSVDLAAQSIPKTAAASTTLNQTPHDRASQRTAQAAKVYNDYLELSKKDNICATKAKEHVLKHNHKDEKAIGYITTKKILTSDEAGQIIDHFAPAYQLLNWGEEHQPRARSSSDPDLKRHGAITSLVKGIKSTVNAVTHINSNNPTQTKPRSNSEPPKTVDDPCTFNTTPQSMIPASSHDPQCHVNKKYLHAFLEFLPNVILKKDFPIEEWKDEFFPKKDNSTPKENKTRTWAAWAQLKPTTKEYPEKADAEKNEADLLQNNTQMHSLAVEKQNHAQNLITSFHATCPSESSVKMATKDPSSYWMGANKDADWFWVMADRFFVDLILGLDDKISKEPDPEKKAELKQATTKLTAQREAWKKVSF